MEQNLNNPINLAQTKEIIKILKNYYKIQHIYFDITKTDKN